MKEEWYTHFEDLFAQFQDWPMVLRMKWCRLIEEQ